MKIDGAIFDLDGTLLDSMFIWDSIGEDYLCKRGIEPHENLNEKFKYMSLYQAACHYQREYSITDSTETIMDDVNKMIQHLYIDEVQPKKGVLRFLSELENRRIKMCVATATDRHLAEAALSSVGLLSFFGEIFTCGIVGHGKDDPDIYHAAHRFLQSPKSTTWIFEDAPYAIKTAKNAGYNVIGVFDPSNCANETRFLANRYIQSFEEMEDMLNEKSPYDSRF